MKEQGQTAANGTVAGYDGDNLPQLGFALVSRPRLDAFVRDAWIVIVAAPAGYGKTTFAVQWARSRAAAGERVVWLDVTAAHADPMAFLRELLQRAAQDQLSGPASRSIFDPNVEMESLFDSILDLIGRTPTWLVINDLHLLEETPAFTYVKRLVDTANSRLRIFITSRSAPSLSLWRRVSSDEVRWVSGQQLAFTAEEIGEAASNFGLSLTPSTRNALSLGSNGWPILVRLAFTVLRDMNQSGGNFDSIDRAAHGMIRAFVREIILVMDDASRQLLTLLAILEDVTDALATTLTGSTKADQSAGTDALIASGLVQMRHTLAGGSVLQLHPVLRQPVGEELSISPETHASICRQAAHWYWSGSQPDRAIATALESDAALAAEWLVSYGDDLVRRAGLHETYLHHLHRLPQELIALHPKLTINQAWSLVLLRRNAEAEKVIRRLADIKGSEATTAHLLLSGVIPALQDDTESACRLLVQPGVDILTWPEFERAAAATMLTFYYKARCDFPAAHESLRVAESAFYSMESSYGLSWCAAAGAILLLKEGQWRSALAASRNFLAGCDEASSASAERGMLLAIEAFVHYERNDLASAKAMLDESLQLLYRQGIVDAIIAGYVTAARIEAAQGNFSDGLDLLVEAERIGYERRLIRLEETMRAERVLMLYRGGQLDQAESLAHQAGFLPLDGKSSSLRNDKGVRLAARLASRQRDIPGLSTQLPIAITRARTTGQRHKLAELLVQKALIDFNQGDASAADVALHEALALAVEEGYVRMFVDEGEPVVKLLRHFAATSPQCAGMVSGHVQEIIRAFPATSSAPEAAPVRGVLPEPLSKRELHVLGLVAQGYSNAEIAQQVFRTEGTIKWHLHNIYCKLGVSGRTAAVNALRQLSLES